MTPLKHRTLRRFIQLGAIACCLISMVACSSKKNSEKYRGMSAETIYVQGEKNLEKENYSAAVNDFEALESHHPYGDYADKGLLKLTYAYYKQNESASALAAADRFIQLYPTHPEVDYAYYLKGLVNFEQNTSFVYRYLPIDRSLRDKSQAEKAFADFSFLIHHFPHSQYVNDARQRMIFLRNQLANHELHVAEYYMKRQAYVAAAERANYILEHFNHTPAIPPALDILRSAYLGMNMPEMAADVDKIIAHNQPAPEEGS